MTTCLNTSYPHPEIWLTFQTWPFSCIFIFGKSQFRTVPFFTVMLGQFGIYGRFFWTRTSTGTFADLVFYTVWKYLSGIFRNDIPFGLRDFFQECCACRLKWLMTCTNGGEPNGEQNSRTFCQRLKPTGFV